MELSVLRLTILVFALLQCVCGNFCDQECTVKPVITPPRLIAKYGEEISVLCTVCESCINRTYGWETPFGHHYKNETEIWLKGANLTEWNFSIICYYTVPKTATQCCTRLDITLYKPPDSVSISYKNHSGPMLEGRLYTLQCLVQDVAPVENLTVTFYKDETALGPPQSGNDTKKEPATELFTVNITPSKEDDGARYWCEARLDLGPQGPQPMTSNITATVYYQPETDHPLDPIRITEGDTLQLNCSASGHPAPTYTWTLPTARPAPNNDSVLIIDAVAFDHEGRYTCVVSNSVGNVTMMFDVDVRVDLLPIIAGLAALLVVVLIAISCFVYTSHYRHTRMGHYQLKDVFYFRRSNHVALPTE